MNTNALDLEAIRRYQGLLQPFEASKTVPTTPFKCLTTDPERVELILVNSGSTRVWVSFGRPLSLGLGVPMEPLGGGIILSTDEDIAIIGGEIWMISDTSSNIVQIFGGRRYNLETKQ